jgi:hypothetical protein
MRRALVVLGVVAAAGFAREAAACSCSGPSSCGIYGRADVVLVGDIVEIRPESGALMATAVKVRVVRAGKGGVEAGQLVAVGTPSESSSCAMGLAVGQRWMLFAGVVEGKLVMSPCTGSHRLGLDERIPDLPPRGGTVHGRLVFPGGGGVDGRRGFPAAAVWIDTPDGRLATRTAEDGGFTLLGVPPGRWTVRADVGPDQQADSVIDVGAGDDCYDVRPWVRPGGGVVGSVMDEGGAPIYGALVTATLAGDVEDTGTFSAWTDERGIFEIHAVAAGSYLVKVGADGEANGRVPYRPVFYPAAAERSTATAITVGGGIVRLEPIVMRGAVPTVSIAVDIVCADGTRPARAFASADRVDGGRDYATNPRETGRRIVRILAGQRYVIRGMIEGTAADANGGVRVAWLDTAAVEIDPARPPDVVQLRADLQGCDAPGGPRGVPRW